MNPRRPLRQLAENLWVAERPQKFYGLPVGTRMTVIRLAGDRLLLHSPVTLDADLRKELDSLGRVSFAVAPNRVHHLHAGEVAQAYPGTRLWVAPGLDRKRPDLVFEAVLTDEAPEEWRGEVGQVFFRGRPYENEVTFLHRASRTLILCDLAFNFGPRSPTPTRLLMKLLRSYGHLGPSKLDPLLIRDRRAARESLERILAWDPDTLFVTHFGPYQGARQQFDALFAHIDEWSRIVRRLLADGSKDDAARERAFVEEALGELRRKLGEEEAQLYVAAGGLNYSWQGLARYWRKRDVAGR